MSTIINQGIKISDLPSISNLESGDLLLVAEKSGQNYATKKIDASYINNLRTVAANLGSSGAQIYEGAVGGETNPLTLRFRRITNGDDISVSQTSDSIIISAPNALKVASNAEVWSGMVTNKAVSPAGLASKMSSDNAGEYIVKRDYQGNFAANIITASLNGNSSSASKLNGLRNVSVSGDMIGTVKTDLSGDVDIATTMKPGVTNTRAWVHVPGSVTGNNTTTDLPDVTAEAYSVDLSYSWVKAPNAGAGLFNVVAAAVSYPNHPFKVGNLFYAQYTYGNVYGDELFMVTQVSTNSFVCYCKLVDVSFTPGVNYGNYFRIFFNGIQNGRNVTSVSSPWGVKNVVTPGYSGDKYYGEYYVNFSTPVVGGYPISVSSLNHGYVHAILPTLLAPLPDGVNLTEMGIDAPTGASGTSGGVNRFKGVDNTRSRLFVNDDYGTVVSMRVGSANGPVYTLRYGDAAFMLKGASDIVGGSGGIINTFMTSGCVRLKFFDQRIHSPAPLIGYNDFMPDYGRGFMMSVF